jgi:hypothetical protein
MNARRKNGNQGKGDTLKAIALASLIATVLASSVALVAAARTLDLGPRVGDILVFKRGMQLPVDWEFTATDNSGEQHRVCTLKPTVMASDGGSLVVEQQSEDKGVYRAHWAGGHTDVGPADCGTAADLTLGRLDLQLLSNAVGGPGVERHLFAF